MQLIWLKSDLSLWPPPLLLIYVAAWEIWVNHHDGPLASSLSYVILAVYMPSLIPYLLPFISVLSGHFHLSKAIKAVIAGRNLWHPPWMIGNLSNTAKSVLRGRILFIEKVVFRHKWSLKIGSIHMTFSMTWQKGDILIQVAA